MHVTNNQSDEQALEVTAKGHPPTCAGVEKYIKDKQDFTEAEINQF